MLGYNFFFKSVIIELNAWEDEWFIIIEALQEGKRNKKKATKKKQGKKRGDLICGQYTNACKLNAK
jgi:hypothetical protein